MPFAIIRCQKCSLGQVAAAEKHNLRKSANHSNPDIDTSRSHTNRVLVSCPSISREVARQVDELQKAQTRKIRKDAPKALEYIVTASPEAFTPTFDEKAYFDASLAFLRARHGEGRIVSAVVHLDESTPHMHVIAVPVNAGKLSAKAYTSRESLRGLQNDFGGLGARFGLQRGSEGSKTPHLSVSEFKARAEAEKAAIEAQIADLREAVTPKPPLIDLPKPKLFQSKDSYGREVAESTMEQLWPTWKALKAKAEDYDNMKTEMKSSKAKLEIATERAEKAERHLQAYKTELSNTRKRLQLAEQVLKRAFDFAEAMAKQGARQLLDLLSAPVTKQAPERSQDKGMSR